MILLVPKKSSQVAWFHSTSIFQRLYFYVWQFIFNVMLFMERQYSTFDGTSNRDDYRTVQWNSSGLCFHVKIDVFFIHVYIMGLDLILYWKTCNCRKVILLNLKMLFCACDVFFCYHKRHIIIQNLFLKLSIFRTEYRNSEIWDCQWHKSFSGTPVFTALILLLLFQIIKKHQCCGFIFTNFFFFSYSP